MSTQFKCISCDGISTNVGATYELGMTSVVSFDGKVFRQSNIRVENCTLTENMSNVICTCMFCGKSGKMGNQFSTVKGCDGCGATSSKGAAFKDDDLGFCDYNGILLCEICFKKAEPTVCVGCSNIGLCDVYSKFSTDEKKKRRAASSKNIASISRAEREGFLSGDFGTTTATGATDSMTFSDLLSENE